MEKSKDLIINAAIMFLFALSGIFMPANFLGSSADMVFLASAIVRFVYSGLGIFFIIRFKLVQILKLRLKNFRSFDVLLVALLVAFNNFPLIPLAQGGVQFTAGGRTAALFVLQCVAVGMFEEIFFRGLIFMLLLEALPKNKKGQLGAVALSSAVFGLTHLVNLFGGAGILPVLAQIGYSAAIGAMLSMVMLFSRSLVLAAFLHTLYNVGGLMVDSLGSGTIWTVPSIILTAVISLLAATYLAVRFALSKHERVAEVN